MSLAIHQEPKDPMAVLAAVLEAYTLALGLCGGTRGGSALWRRSRQPKVGDLVSITFTSDPDISRTVGWLLKVNETLGGESYLIDPIFGDEPIRWENVGISSVPVGDMLGPLLGDTDRVFQPSPES